MRRTLPLPLAPERVTGTRSEGAYVLPSRYRVSRRLRYQSPVRRYRLRVSAYETFGATTPSGPPGWPAAPEPSRPTTATARPTRTRRDRSDPPCARRCGLTTDMGQP